MVQKAFVTPFAENGNKVLVPDAINPSGAVSYDEGFGPDYEREQVVDPLAKNIERGNHNAIFNDVTLSLQEMQSGVGTSIFSVALATAIGGYAKGAVIPNIAGTGSWISTANANTVDPLNAGSSWLPYSVAGVLSKTLTNANVTLTNAEAANPIIKLSGVLTANVNLVIPAWAYSWAIDDATTGNFTVTVKTAAAAGVVLKQGQLNSVSCDGVNAKAVSGGGAEMPTGSSTSKPFYLNDQIVDTDYTIPTGKNAMSAGPITINSGVTVTVPNGSTWVVV